MEDADIRKAELLIEECFGSDDTGKEKTKRQRKSKQEELYSAKDSSGSAKEASNPRLTFELKNLGQSHTYLLRERDLDKKTIREFGIGFCNRGLMKGRTAIPIRDENGELVAYAGRYPGKPPEGESKYRVPPKFHKHLIPYSFHRAIQFSGEKNMVIVEGFFDAMKPWQSGFRNVVALMGASLSDEQEELLIGALGPGGKLALMLDSDKAGLRAAKDITKRLIAKLYVKAIDLREEEVGADGLAEERIKEMLKE